MVSYVEQPHRVKSSRLFGKLNLKTAQNKAGVRDERSDQDSVKIIQDRMLHTVLHDRDTAIYNPTLQINNTKKRTQFSNVRPPRGTLSDEKLPYLDWRLSLLQLKQLQIEEHAEYLCRKSINQQKVHKKTLGQSIVPSSSSNLIPMRKQKSTLSDSTGSDLGSDMSSGQGIDILDYLDAAVYPQHDSWHSSTVKDIVQYQNLYSNTVLHQTLLTNEALAAVPLLNDGNHFLSTDSINEEEDEDLYFEAVDSLDKNLASNLTVPAPRRSASLYSKTPLQSKSMEKTSASNTRRLPRLFSRTPRRPAPASRSQSHGCIPTTTSKPTNESALDNINQINDGLDRSEKPKRKWNLLSLHNLGGSEAMIRESDLSNREMEMLR